MIQKASKQKIILCTLCMIILILDTTTSVDATKEGIELCLCTVIPALFPFLLISVIINQSTLLIRFRLLGTLSNFLQIPIGNENILIPAFLGGYPLGANAISYAWQNKRLPLHHAHRMMGFCNNAGPAFIFGMASGMFATPLLPYLLWGIHIFSAVLTAKLLPIKHSHTKMAQSYHSQNNTKPIDAAIKSMAGICVWVIITRIFLAFMEKWFLHALPETITIIITGVLELSNGAIELYNVDNEGLRFILFSGLLGFGGICVLLQTITVTADMGIGAYLPGKLMQCTISLLLSYILQRAVFTKKQQFYMTKNISILLLIIILIAVCLLVGKKTVAFSGNIMYNKQKNCEGD